MEFVTFSYAKPLKNIYVHFSFLLIFFLSLSFLNDKANESRHFLIHQYENCSTIDVSAMSQKFKFSYYSITCALLEEMLT